MEKVYIFLAEGFEEVEGLMVVDLLRRANIDIQMVSMTKQRLVSGSHGIEIMANGIFEEQDFGDAAMLVLPGGMPGTLNLAGHQGLSELLKQANAQEKLISAICAAPSVLGKLGILDGKRAVCYPGLEDKLHCLKVTENEVEMDGNITTSRGLGTSIPFALALIERLKDHKEALRVKESIIFKG